MSSSLLKLSGFVESFDTAPGFELRCACDVSIWLMTIDVDQSSDPSGSLDNMNINLTSIFKHHLPLGTFKNILFHRVLAHEAIDTDMGLLSDTMRTSHRLQVILGIPIALRIQKL